jgi:Tfp pilus assembly protein PilV
MCFRHSHKTGALCATARSGFTLVEVLVAVLLLDIGLLALAAGSAALVRQTNMLRARQVALQLAEVRIETLGARGCVAAGGSASGPLGFTEDWSSQLIGRLALELFDSVTFTVQRQTRSIALRTRLPC